MDEFHNPQPHTAAAKEIVNAVLTWVAGSGETLLHVLAGLLAASLMLYSGYVLYDSAYTSTQAYTSSWELLKYKPEIISDGAQPTSGGATLAEINQDYRAWITMYDTMIDYPIMQGENDYYYANHDVYRVPSLTGSIYMAAGSTRTMADRYNLLYGHHMNNGAMFGAIDKYRTNAFFNAHRDGVLVSESGVYDLKAFAVAETDAYEDEIYLVGPTRDAQEIINFLRTGSASTNTLIFDDAATQGANRVVALSTCADATTNGRLVVFCTATRRNMLSLDLPSYDKIYDAQEHKLIATPNYPDDTTVEYSTDGGVNWSTTPPALTNVGSLNVSVRAHNDVYGDTTATGTLTVRAKPATVTARAAGKVYGDPDPAFAYDTDGIIDGYELICSVSRPGATTDENVGTYPDAIVPTGAATQGNYTVTYVPARFTIIPAVPTVQAVSYEGVYDGKTHTASALPDVPDGTTVEYRLVGGSDADWSTTPPSITHVGTVEFEVRATNPNYVTAYATGTMTVNRRPVTVTAKPASKAYDTKDPAFEAVVSGTVGKETIQYKVSRTNKAEAIGVYTDAIVPTGRDVQGDYTVTYIPADFTITQSGALTLSASDYEGLYDARAHKPSATVNITDGTTIEYSTDGKTWSKTAPSITDVGTLRVYVRASNPKYTTVETTVTLTVNPRPVKVIAEDTVKVYGSADPVFTARVTGLVDDFKIQYTVNRRGTDEKVGTYRDALVPTGEQRQGNYVVTYVPADLTVAPNRMVLIAEGWDNVYDGESHKPDVTVTVEDGTTITYSTDGGETWTETPPEIRNVGEITVEVRATNPNYEPVTQTVTLRVTPRPVKVLVNDTTKTSGEDDPTFTATVEGLLGDDTIDYTITRTTKSEKAGTYENSLRAEGEELQGNYSVTYESATLTILPSKAVPASWSFFDIFKPNGSSDKVWALVNLLCLVMMAYLLLPVPHLKDKYGRIKQMRRYNEAIEETEADDERPDSELFEYKVKRFLQRLRIGVAAETALLIGAVIIFIITENLHNPMVLIDKYTPMMLLMMIATWLIDVRLARYRSGLEKEAEEQTEAAQES